MSLDVDISSDGVRSPLGRQRTQEVVEDVLRSGKVRNALVSVTFLDKRAMARMNKKHLNHSGATDVISFGFTRATATDPVVGDIYICPDVARENARARGEPVRREVARLVVHGALHILGHEHPDEEREKSAMWRKQERLVARITSHPARTRPGGHPARRRRERIAVPSAISRRHDVTAETASPEKRSFRRPSLALRAPQDDAQGSAPQDDAQSSAPQDDAQSSAPQDDAQGSAPQDDRLGPASRSRSR